MPLVNDYSLCQQTVTVYHNDGATVTRTVHPKAYLDHKRTEAVDKVGSAESNGFLLVIPAATQACHVGDKVYEGEGPDVPATGQQAWWRGFIPTKVDALVVVRHVGVRRWAGSVVHTEAGG
jgi:hypothetical protein